MSQYVLFELEEYMCKLMSKLSKNDISLYQIYLPKLHENILK